MQRSLTRTAASIALICAMLGSNLAQAEWHRDEQAIMGTRVHAELWHVDSAVAEALLAEVMAEMRRIESVFSPYIEGSELSRLNRQAAAGWQTVSAEMYALLAAAARISALSDGAFDITYASAGHLYNYRQRERPDADALAAALPAIDYRFVQLREPDQVRFERAGVLIDLGGIAKGYAVDRAIERLERRGVSQAIVAAGGDSRILGDRRGRPWSVGVQHPRRPQEMIAVLPLVDTAVSTSGDYERYFEREGIRFHHILDPTSGDSARGLRSVTIMGPEGIFTDALSTAVFVLGVDAGLALIDRLPGIDAVLVDASGALRYSADIAPAAAD
ncbi:MAG: FAD:protein FMN transferase [Pseudomonadota bacterium]